MSDYSYAIHSIRVVTHVCLTSAVIGDSRLRFKNKEREIENRIVWRLVKQNWTKRDDHRFPKDALLSIGFCKTCDSPNTHSLTFGP